MLFYKTELSIFINNQITMTIFQPLLTNYECEGSNDDNFEVSVTEKKLSNLFKNVSNLFKNIIEIEDSVYLDRLDTSKLTGRNLIIFYNMEFDLDELILINRLYNTYNISVIYCDCK